MKWRWSKSLPWTATHTGLAAISTVVGANLVATSVIAPFVITRFGLSAGETSILLFSFPMTAFLGNLLAGSITDRVDYRALLRLGSLALTALFVLSAVAPDWKVLAILRALTGLIMPMLSVTAFTVTRSFDQKQGLVVAIMFAASGLAQAFFIPVVLLLGSATWRLGFILLACGATWIVWAVWSADFVKDLDVRQLPSAVASSYAQMIGYRHVVVRLAAYALLSASSSLFGATYPTWLMLDLGVSGAGLALPLCIGAGAVVFGSTYAGYMHNRTTPRGLSLIVPTLVGSVAFVLSAATGSRCLICSCLFYSCALICVSATLPVLRTQVMKAAPAAGVGRANGMWNAVGQLGSGVGAALAGLTSKGIGYYAQGGGAAALMLAAGCLLAVSGLHRDLRVDVRPSDLNT